MSVEVEERKGLLHGEVGKRLRVAVEYAPMALLSVLLLCTLLVLSGQSSEGAWGEIYGSLRGQLAGEDRPAAERLKPRLPARQVRRASLPPPTVVPLPITLPPVTVTQTLPCPTVYLHGTLIIKDGYVSFGSFNTVTDTDPYGTDDPLASWKLVQCERFPLPTVEDKKSLSIPVGRQVNLVIVDPFTREPLFAARWRVATMEVRGRTASINADLEENLSQIRVNNAIDSPTLAAFAADAAGTTGMLVLYLEHDEEIAAALVAGRPIYAPMSGVMRGGGCR